MQSYDLFKNILIKIHKKAKDRGYIEKDAIMVEELSSKGNSVCASWLGDAEFFETFKGNSVGYYLGLCVNCFASGMVLSDGWADGGDRVASFRYDEIYEGGVWNNIFVLMEMTNDNDKKDFQNFLIELYEMWVVELKDVFSSPNANEYILKTLTAFFALGVTMRLEILGY